MSSFRLLGVSADRFDGLFNLSARELETIRAVRVTATSRPGFPCRVSLVDAEPGEELMLLPFEHQPANSPYRASGPIYVRRGASQRILEAGQVPEYVTLRQISLRSYDQYHMMIAAEVREGSDVAGELDLQFRNPEVRYIHLHNAKRGCFSCLVERAP